MSRKFFTPPQPSPWKGEGVRNSQMMRGLLYFLVSEVLQSLSTARLKIDCLKVLLLPILSELRSLLLECDRALLTFAKAWTWTRTIPGAMYSICAIFWLLFPPQLKPRFLVLAASADFPKLPHPSNLLGSAATNEEIASIWGTSLDQAGPHSRQIKLMM